MGEIEFVVQDGCEKERCGFGAKDERTEGGRTKASCTGSPNFGGGEIAFGANK